MARRRARRDRRALRGTEEARAVNSAATAAGLLRLKGTGLPRLGGFNWRLFGGM